MPLIIKKSWFTGRGDEGPAGGQDGEAGVHRGGQGEGPASRGQQEPIPTFRAHLFRRFLTM